MLFLKPAFYIESNELDWKGEQWTHLFVQQQQKNTQVGRYLYPLSKSEQGQMIKKGKKNICTILFNKVMKYRISG